MSFKPPRRQADHVIVTDETIYCAHCGDMLDTITEADDHGLSECDTANKLTKTWVTSTERCKCSEEEHRHQSPCGWCLDTLRRYVRDALIEEKAGI